MISHYTEYSLVVIPSGLGIELNDNSHLTLRLNSAFYFRKTEYIRSIIEKLELCWLVRIIDDIQKSVCALLELYLAKVNRFGRQWYIDSIRLPSANQLQGITTDNINLELPAGKLTGYLWLVRYTNDFLLSGWNDTMR